MIAVFVPGNPAPQGSKKFVGKSGAGRAIMIESCKRLPGWRESVRAALLNDENRPKHRFEGPVHMEAEFVLPRPKGAPKTKTARADKKPDASKLLRAIEDAITSAGVWRDDAQVTSLMVTKRIAKIGETPGCHIEIMEAK